MIAFTLLAACALSLSLAAHTTAQEYQQPLPRIHWPHDGARIRGPIVLLNYSIALAPPTPIPPRLAHDRLRCLATIECCFVGVSGRAAAATTATGGGANGDGAGARAERRACVPIARAAARPAVRLAYWGGGAAAASVKCIDGCGRAVGPTARTRFHVDNGIAVVGAAADTTDDDALPDGESAAVPNVVHFVFGLSPDFGGKPFSLVHYLAVLAAKARLRPDAIMLHYVHEPRGRWWRRARRHLTLRPIPPTLADGLAADAAGTTLGDGDPFDWRGLAHVAHKSDVVRLLVLLREGGVYMDMDVIALAPFDRLRAALDPRAAARVAPASGVVTVGAADGSGTRTRRIRAGVVMAAEGVDGLGNAVVLARPGAAFVRRWLRYYAAHRADARGWADLSVKLPLRLALAHPREAVVLPNARAFFHPGWTRSALRDLFGRADGERDGGGGTYKLLMCPPEVLQGRRRKCLGFVFLTIGNACFV